MLEVNSSSLCDLHLAQAEGLTEESQVIFASGLPCKGRVTNKHLCSQWSIVCHVLDETLSKHPGRILEKYGPEVDSEA